MFVILQIVVDRDALAKAMTGTQDVHMQVIDGREDQLVTRIRSWAATMCEEIHKYVFLCIILFFNF